MDRERKTNTEREVYQDIREIKGDLEEKKE
jgi:hypothetical protein